LDIWGYVILEIIVVLLTIACLLLWKPTREGLLQRPKYAPTISCYWVNNWSDDAIKKELNHDFVGLGRKTVDLHYHSTDSDCNEQCRTVTNPNLLEGNK
jgi:hypothetical protein